MSGFVINVLAFVGLTIFYASSYHAAPLPEYVSVDSHSDDKYIEDVGILLELFKYMSMSRASAEADPQQAVLSQPIHPAWKRNGDIVNALLNIPKNLHSSG